MKRKRRPDPETRLVSHLLVGCIAGAATGKRSGFGGFLAAALLAAFAHEALDAPVAQILTDVGM